LKVARARAAELRADIQQQLATVYTLSRFPDA
jgi:hypothetical protein